ncbi:flagellar biosynthetic protein FliO [Bosea sp. (in: a-proteobacteria)]|uniref:flagellar biosynthetic protein FliO n=1 Tax=Bosea sp. (in: a-proteobacteria) TaxID=1871050 RepID=UPI0026356BF4|nr:flagellar biosynthetic protein FliO [Bosea sp. (in: a-proteobacteria)]
MQSLFGLELSTAQKVIVASVVILVLLALLGLFVRQIQGGRLRLRGQAGGRQRQPRLGVVDTYDLDRQRQLVLIRRDNIEHLLMIGGASDVVVETNILRSGGRSAQPAYAEAAPADRPLPPFETLVPPSEPAMRAGDEARRAGLEAPDVLPPLPSRPVPVPAEAVAPIAAAAAGVTAALGAIAAERAEPAAPVAPVTTGPAPSFAREHAPAPAVSPGELDDMTRQLEEALKRPFSAVRPAKPAGEAPAMEPPAPEQKPAAMPFPEIQAPPVEAVVPVAMPPEPEPEPVAPPAPAAPPRQKPVPSEVEAELAAALGLTLERIAPSPPEPVLPEPLPPEPVLAEPGPVEVPAPEPEPPAPEPVVEDEPAPDEPAAVDAVAEEPGPVESPTVEPEPEKPAEEPAAKEIDPFSVDAIEAEFARLLGRDPKSRS